MVPDFQFTRFFNHSCQPNLFLTAYYCDDIDIQKPLLTLFCDRVIKAGQELTFSYTGLDVNDPEVSCYPLLNNRKLTGRRTKPRFNKSSEKETLARTARCLKDVYAVRLGALELSLQERDKLFRFGHYVISSCVCVSLEFWAWLWMCAICLYVRLMSIYYPTCFFIYDFFVASGSVSASDSKVFTGFQTSLVACINS